jgi:hypothetical protein
MCRSRIIPAATSLDAPLQVNSLLGGPMNKMGENRDSEKQGEFLASSRGTSAIAVQNLIRMANTGQ